MQILLVGLGGLVGSILRYKLSGFVLHHFQQSKIITGTLLVNLLGLFILGILTSLIEKHHILNQEIRLFVFTGLLGGFTTYSAFGHEVVFLLRQNHLIEGILLVALTLLGGLLLLWLGIKLGSL